MAVQVQFRRGNTSQHSTFTGAEGEITVNTDKDILVVHDGTTAGGHELASSNSPFFSGNITIESTAKISANGSYGTANQVLTSNGNGVFWSTTSGGGFTNGQSISVNNFVVTGSITANGSNGVAGYVLRSNGSSAYWETTTNGTVTSVSTGNGMTGGVITDIGTVSVLANTGIVANATGLFVNATYIETISANNTSFLGGVAAASYVNTSGAYTLSGNISFSSNLTIDATGELIIANGAGIYANGGLGTNGQVLTSNGSAVYWSTSAGGGGGGISSLSFVGFYSGYNNPTTGTLRRYFANNITVTKMTAWVGVTSGSNLKLTLKKNGSEIANTIIAANASIANVTFSANVISDVDYLTLDLTSGSGTDIGVRIDYTPYA